MNNDSVVVLVAIIAMAVVAIAVTITECVQHAPTETTKQINSSRP